MCAIARGETLEEFGQRPGVFSIINTNTPLQYDVPMTIGVIDMARHGQPTLLTPFVMAGASTPATIASAMAMTCAEILFGVTLAQLVRPGAPVMFGCASTNIDMKTGAPAYGMADMMKCTIIGGQMVRRYELPLRSSNFSASNIPDFASGYKSANAVSSAVSAGANLLMHAAGWVEGGLCTSYEKFVLDCEIVQSMAHVLEPVVVDDDALALAEFDRSRTGRSFLWHSPYDFNLRNGLLPAAHFHHAEPRRMAGGRRQVCNRTRRGNLAANPANLHGTGTRSRRPRGTHSLHRAPP